MEDAKNSNETEEERFNSLMAQLSDPDEDTRLDAVADLGTLGFAFYAKNPQVFSIAVEGLIERLKEDDSKYVRGYAAWALGELKDTRAISPLITALKDKLHLVRYWVAHALYFYKDKKVTEALLEALKNEDALNWDLCQILAMALAEQKELSLPILIDNLVDNLEIADDKLRSRIIYSFDRMLFKRGIIADNPEFLQNKLLIDYWFILSQKTGLDYARTKLLLEFLSSEDIELRSTAIILVGIVGDQQVLPILEKIRLSDQSQTNTKRYLKDLAAMAIVVINKKFEN